MLSASRPEAIVAAIESRPELRARFARAILPDVLALLGAAVAKTNAPTVYSTRKGHEPPEYRGRDKRSKEDAPLIPGAFKQADS